MPGLFSEFSPKFFVHFTVPDGCDVAFIVNNIEVTNGAVTLERKEFFRTTQFLVKHTIFPKMFGPQ